MGPKRPTLVLVIAILHFTLGGLSLFYGVCGIGAQLVMQAKLLPQPPTVPGRPKPITQEEIQNYVEQRVPSYKVMLFGGMTFELCLSILMISAGFGLLQMRTWGRHLSIGYACLSVAFKLFGIVYAFLVSLPIMNEFLNQVPDHGPETMIMVKTMRVALSATPVMQLSYMIYPIAVLVVMNLPSVSAAFRGQPRNTEPDNSSAT